MARPSKSQAGQAIMDMKVGSPAWWQVQAARFETKRDAEVKDNWDYTLELYKSDQSMMRNVKPRRGRQALYAKYVQPPRVYGIVHAIEAVLFNKRPKFFCTPATSRQEELARLCEMWLNSRWRLDKQLGYQVRLSLRDCIRHGLGVTLTDYMPSKDDAARAKERRERQQIAEQLQADVLAQAGVEDFAELAATIGDSIDMPERMATFENTSLSVKDMVCSRRISPYQYIKDPDSRYGTQDALWVGRIFRIDVDMLQRIPGIKNLSGLKGMYTYARSEDNMPGMGRVKVGRTEITQGGVGTTFWDKYGAGMTSNGKTSEEYRYVDCLELFLRSADEDGAETWDYRLMAKDHDKWLKEVDAMYDLGCPYSELQFNQTGEDLFAQSDIDPAMTHILEEREVRTRFFEWMMRNANDAYAIDTSGTQNAEAMINAIRRTQVGSILPMQQTGNRPVRDLFYQLPRTQVSSEYLNYLALIERNIELATGLGPNQMLAAMKSETSATEAAEVAGWARARMQPKSDAFEDYVAEIATKEMQIVAQEYSVERIFQELGPKAAALWTKESFPRGDIQSKLNITVDKGSMMPESDQKRQQVLMTLVTQSLSNPAFASIVNVPEAVMRLLHTFGIEDGSELIRRVDPMAFAQQLAMQQQMGGGGGSAPAPPAMAGSPAQEAEFAGAPR